MGMYITRALLLCECNKSSPFFSSSLCTLDICHTRSIIYLSFFLMPHDVQGGKFVGVKADNTEVQLATILVAPTLAWNAVPVNNAASLGEVVSVKFEAADGSYGNIAEIKLYRSC